MADANSTEPLCERLHEIAADIGSCQNATFSVLGVRGGDTVEDLSILWLVESKLRQLNETLSRMADEVSGMEDAA